MDPSRLKRHFDWESKSFLPLDTKDNEGAAFPLLSFFIVAVASEGDRQLKVICAHLSLAGLIEFTLLFFVVFFFPVSNCSHKQNDGQINHKHLHNH